MAVGTPTNTSLFFKKRKLPAGAILILQFNRMMLCVAMGPTSPFPDLSLCGLTEADGVFMSAKELLDNAIDACVQRPPDKSLKQAPAIELTVQKEDGGVTVICCRDQGVGFSPESVEAVGILFATSKFGDTNTGGVFGIGLKVVGLGELTLAIALDRLYGASDLRARVSATENWYFNVRFLAGSGESTIEDFQITPVSSMRIQVKGKWDAAVQVALRRLVAASSFLRPQISFSLNMTGALSLYRSADLLPLDTLLHRWATVAKDAGREIVAMAEKVIDTPEFHVEVASVALKPAEGPRKPSPHAKLRLLRVFNSTVLVPEGSPVCGIRKALWRFVERCGYRYGIERKARALHGVTRNNDVSPELEPNGTCLPACFFEALQEAASCMVVGSVNENSWNEITIIVSIESTKTYYGDLGKTFIREVPKLNSALRQLLSAVFDAMKSTAPRAFCSVQETEMKQAREIYVPQLARSVANIIRRSQNAEFRNAAFLLLGIRDGVDWSPIRTLTGSRDATDEPGESTIGGGQAKAHTYNLEERLRDLIMYGYRRYSEFRQPSLFSGREKLNAYCTIPCPQLPASITKKNAKDVPLQSCRRGAEKVSDGTGSETESGGANPDFD